MATSKKQTPVETTEPATTIIGFDAETKEILRELAQAMANRPAPIINLASVETKVLESILDRLATPAVAPTFMPVPPSCDQYKVVDPPMTQVPAVTAMAQVPAAKVSLSQIREGITLKMSEGKTNEVKALLTTYGAKNASTLSEENFGPFYSQLLNL